MNAETKQSSALVVVLSILGVTAVAMTGGLVLMQKDVQEVVNLASVSDTNFVTSSFDYTSWAREGAAYPPLLESENAPDDFIADYTGSPEAIPSGETVLPDETPATPQPPAASPSERVVETVPAAVQPPVRPVVPAAVDPPQPRYREIRENAWWVQVIASGSLAAADEVRSSLADQGISSRVMTQDTGSGLVYRVRLGPFSSEREATSSAGSVRGMDGFSDSYVTLAPVTRRVPVTP